MIPGRGTAETLLSTAHVFTRVLTERKETKEGVIAQYTGMSAGKIKSLVQSTHHVQKLTTIYTAELSSKSSLFSRTLFSH